MMSRIIVLLPKQRLVFLFLVFSFYHFPSFTFAQTTQTIRGTVYDKDSKSTLIGAAVMLISDTGKINGCITDIDGKFRLEQVPLGRRAIRVTFTGYKELMIPNIIVDAGKETILTIELEESVIKMEAVEINGTKKEEANNDMATVSTRTFSVEESNRYAGSRSDPARMASNYAGVQGADDSRNDIVIRGNSPMGVLWRLNDIDIPNPNHFAVPGTTGGAVSVLNNKTLANSDFMTGAFPAEYGNANAGVFDLRMRNGNNEKHEFTGQFGFLGTELMAEGPLSKTSGASYLLAYRYSTLKLFESFKIPIGTSAVPNYQDAAFKINLPTKNAGIFSIFGVGGWSNIAILVSTTTNPTKEIYGLKDRDQYFTTSMGVIGLSHTKSINAKWFSKFTVAGSGTAANSQHDLVVRDSTYALKALVPKMRYSFTNGKLSLIGSLNGKLNARHSVKIGFMADQLYSDFTDSIYNEFQYYWITRLQSVDYTWLTQAYVQWKYKPTDQLVFNGGLHASWFELTNSFALEPRIGTRWNFKPAHSLSAGYGMHSQLQPMYIYYYSRLQPSGNYLMHNKQLGFTRSQHTVIAYDYVINTGTRVKIETYYQYLYQVPVDRNRSSSFSLLNQGSVFSRFFPDSLSNTGTGYNYGAEFTLERFFSKNYFALFTVSVYDSKYNGSDGVERNTDFNGGFAGNLLAGKEFNIGKKKNTILSLGGKITYAGGRRYSPPDTAASRLAGEVVAIDNQRNIYQFRNYFRADLKVGIKINTRKITHELALDLVNVFNTKNLLGITYAPNPANPKASPMVEEYQLGFLPLFYYKVDF